MRSHVALVLFAALTTLTTANAAEVGSVEIARWADGELDSWRVERFSGDTKYAVVNEDGKRHLSAVADGTASGLFIEKQIDLGKTPWLTWSWRIKQPLSGLNERSKDGDDYAARVYVVISGGAFFWRTRALNYVWSGSQKSGRTWPNAFTDNARMIAIRGVGENVGEWVSEKRNVLQDLREAFGEEITQIDAIAIMTDADNSGRQTAADYGPLHFSGR